MTLGSSRLFGRAFYRSGTDVQGRSRFLAGPLAGLCTASLLALAPGCANFNLYSESDDISLGEEAYTQILAENQVISGGSDAAMVQRVMQRIAAVTPRAEEYPWQVSLLDAPDLVNAFCLPGGKMAVYSGILPVCQGETGLAVVMGHEVAHAIARHGTERMSREQLKLMGFELAELDERYGASAELAGLLLAEYGMSLPFSRSDELEADKEGLFFMARAGYDPRESARFWTRMSGGGGDDFDFFSTHPADATRIEQLEGLMPEAMALYEQALGSGSGSGTGF